MSVSTVRYDPADPAVLADPYPAYARLRAEAPVEHLPEHDIWLVSRYDDVARVIRDPATFSSRLGMSPPPVRAGDGTPVGVGYRIGAPNVRVLIATDPPEHRIFRHAVAACFTPAAIDALQPRLEGVVTAQVDRLLEAGAGRPVDFFAEVAEPVPALVLATMLGVPETMHDEFRAWSAVITSDLASHAGDRAPVGRGIDMFRYFGRKLRDGTAGGGDGLFDAIARGRTHGITDAEALAFNAFLLVAGIETTTSLLTNLLDLLMRRPELADRLRAEPQLIPAAVEEAVRYDTSVQALWRATTGEVELAGRLLPAGARVLVLFGSANRDERRFDRAGEFLIEREAKGHLGFGAGPHFCLGARLARAEMIAVLGQLLGRTRSIRPAPGAVRTGSAVLRGFVRQPIRVEAR